MQWLVGGKWLLSQSLSLFKVFSLFSNNIWRRQSINCYLQNAIKLLCLKLFKIIMSPILKYLLEREARCQICTFFVKFVCYNFVQMHTFLIEARDKWSNTSIGMILSNKNYYCSWYQQVYVFSKTQFIKYFLTNLLLAEEWKHESDCTVSQSTTINLVHC